MACLNTLKLEIKTLERTFTKNHDRFRILHASVDELTCRFIGKNGKNYDIHANITVITLFVTLFFSPFHSDSFSVSHYHPFQLCVCVRNFRSKRFIVSFNMNN